MVLGLPLSGVKLSDVVSALGVVDGRLAAIEARLAKLEGWQEEHERSKAERERKVDAALAELRRMRRASPT